MISCSPPLPSPVPRPPFPRPPVPAQDMLLAQDDYVQGVARAHKEACELNGKKHLKDERLRELLKAPHLRRVPARGGGRGAGSGDAGGGGDSVPMPLDPTVQARGNGVGDWMRRRDVCPVHRSVARGLVTNPFDTIVGGGAFRCVHEFLGGPLSSM